MGIREHPHKGSIILCDFTDGFKNPEMDKKRPVIVLSPKIKARPGLCTVVSLSTTEPHQIMPYHRQIDLPSPVPKPYESKSVWVKGDMVNTVAFHRLNFMTFGKDRMGKRIYYYKTLDEKNLKIVHECVLRALGLSSVTKCL